MDIEEILQLCKITVFSVHNYCGTVLKSFSYIFDIQLRANTATESENNLNEKNVLQTKKLKITT